MSEYYCTVCGDELEEGTTATLIVAAEVVGGTWGTEICDCPNQETLCQECGAALNLFLRGEAAKVAVAYPTMLEACVVALKALQEHTCTGYAAHALTQHGTAALHALRAAVARAEDRSWWRTTWSYYLKKRDELCQRS